MGKTIDRHEMIADYLDEMETDIRALRALAVTAPTTRSSSHQAALRATSEPRGPDRLAQARAPRHHKPAPRRDSPRCSSTSPRRRPSRSRGARADPRRRRLHQGVRRREAAARRARHADLRGHQPDPVADGDEGHARRIIKNPQGFVRRLARRAGARSRPATRWRSVLTKQLGPQEGLRARDAARRAAHQDPRRRGGWASCSTTRP
jgi:hypothetical protein